MKRKTILVDLDGITADIYKTWSSLYEAETGEILKVKKEYRLTEVVSHPDVLCDILERKGFFSSLFPLPGAIKYLKKIMAKHDVHILTQPPREANFAIADKKEWVKRYFPEYDTSKMIFAHCKYLIRGDILFDDSPKHLVEWKEYNPKGQVVTITYEYNKDIPVTVRFKKKTAWKQFHQWLKNNASK